MQRIWDIIETQFRTRADGKFPARDQKRAAHRRPNMLILSKLLFGIGNALLHAGNHDQWCVTQIRQVLEHRNLNDISSDQG